MIETSPIWGYTYHPTPVCAIALRLRLSANVPLCVYFDFTLNVLSMYPSFSMQVGTYDPNNGLQVQRDLITFYDVSAGQERSSITSVCDPLSRQCAPICGEGRSTTTSSPTVSASPIVGEGGEEGLMAAVAVLVVLCALLLVLVVVVVVCARRRRVPLKTFFQAPPLHGVYLGRFGLSSIHFVLLSAKFFSRTVCLIIYLGKVIPTMQLVGHIVIYCEYL